jgi:hypothetical protein
MKKIALALVAAAALAGAGMAISSGGPNEKLASQSRAYGGGQFWFPNGVARAFALDAHVDGNGGGAAYGTWEYGPPTGPWHVRGDITCMTIDGNVAIVGGWVRDTERSDLAGLAFLTYVRDNGTPGSGAQDEASVSWFGGTTGTANGDFPTSFPQTCPAGVGAFADTPPSWFPLVGDVVVQR